MKRSAKYRLAASVLREATRDLNSTAEVDALIEVAWDLEVTANGPGFIEYGVTAGKNEEISHEEKRER